MLYKFGITITKCSSVVLMYFYSVYFYSTVPLLPISLLISLYNCCHTGDLLDMLCHNMNSGKTWIQNFNSAAENDFIIKLSCFKVVFDMAYEGSVTMIF